MDKIIVRRSKSLNLMLKNQNSINRILDRVTHYKYPLNMSNINTALHRLNALNVDKYKNNLDNNVNIKKLHDEVRFKMLIAHSKELLNNNMTANDLGVYLQSLGRLKYNRKIDPLLYNKLEILIQNNIKGSSCTNLYQILISLPNIGYNEEDCNDIIMTILNELNYKVDAMNGTDISFFFYALDQIYEYDNFSLVRSEMLEKILPNVTNRLLNVDTNIFNASSVAYLCRNIFRCQKYIDIESFLTIMCQLIEHYKLNMNEDQLNMIIQSLSSITNSNQQINDLLLQLTKQQQQ